jgi:hypothetical protein
LENYVIKYARYQIVNIHFLAFFSYETKENSSAKSPIGIIQARA